MSKRPKDWRPKVPKIGGKPRRKSRAKYSKRFFASVKKIRRSLAILKRKKILPKSVPVRTALPTRSLQRIVRKNKDVVAGVATAWKLPEDAPKEIVQALRKQGHRITGKGAERRVVLKKAQYARKGRVYERPTISRPGMRIDREPIILADMEGQIRKAFDDLRDGDMVGFEIEGENGKSGKSYSMYGSADSMLRDLQAYLERGFKFVSLATFTITKAKQPEFIANSRERAFARVIGSDEYRAKRKAARANARKRQNARGIRSSRGH